MPNPSKQKGSRFERQVVNEAKSMGHKAKRIPLSGAVEGFKGDVQIGTMVCECKKRRNPIAFISKNLKPNMDALLIGCDGGQWWAVMRGPEWMKLI